MQKRTGYPPVLVMYDNHHKGLWAIEVEDKRVNREIVKFINDRLEDSGYAGMKITLKSDQAEEMVALKRAVALKRKAETTPIESPVWESKSNGQIERMIRSWQGQFRTLKK